MPRKDLEHTDTWGILQVSIREDNHYLYRCTNRVVLLSVNLSDVKQIVIRQIIMHAISSPCSNQFAFYTQTVYIYVMYKLK